MVYTCYICKWRSDRKPQRSFHQFPTEESLRKKWLEKIGKSDVVLGKRTSVCCVHFEKSCFRYGLVHGREMLNPGSIPSLYLTGKTDMIPQEHFEPEPAEVGLKVICFTNGINIVNDSQARIISEKILGAISHNNEAIKTINPKMLTPDIINQKNLQTPCSIQKNINESSYEKRCVGEPLPQRSVAMANNFTDSNIVENLKIELRRKSKRISYLNRTIRRLQQQRTHLRGLIKKNSLEKKGSILEMKNNILNSNLGPIPKALFSHMVSRKKKVVHYPSELRDFSTTLATLSPSAYKYIREVFPSLPHNSTLRKWRQEHVTSENNESGLSSVKTLFVEEDNTDENILYDLRLDHDYL